MRAWAGEFRSLSVRGGQMETRWGTVEVEPAYEQDGSAATTVVGDLPAPGWAQWRMAAESNDGTVHVGQSTAGRIWPEEGNRESTWVFEGLSPDEVQGLKLQVRRSHRVVFRNVSLKPGHRTTVEIEGEEG